MPHGATVLVLHGQMKAEVVRFAIWACFAVLAGFVWLQVDGWAAWIACAGILAVGGALADRMFRRLAAPEELQADLEDRARSGQL